MVDQLVYRTRTLHASGGADAREEVWELQTGYPGAVVTLDTVTCEYRRHGERRFMVRSQGHRRACRVHRLTSRCRA
jgi:hypothetical protein